MNLVRCGSKEGLALRAAADGGTLIRDALQRRGEANIIVATGMSQDAMLAELVGVAEIDWSRVTGFHPDEYIGIPAGHRASFRGFLRDRFVDHVRLKAFHYIEAESDPAAECRRLGDLLARLPIDVAFIGIGENGHIAFNDPPADFETEAPYLVVALDEACRRQQVGEGWFRTLADVPRRAISMSIRQILKSARIVCCVPDTRKARAVQAALEGPVTPQVPASILQTHPAVTVYVDPGSGAMLTQA